MNCSISFDRRSSFSSWPSRISQLASLPAARAAARCCRRPIVITSHSNHSLVFRRRAQQGYWRGLDWSGTDQPFDTRNADEVGPVHNPLSLSLAQSMISYDMAGFADNNTTRQHNDLDAFTYETPGYGLTVGVEIDGAVCLHLAHEIAQLTKRCTA
jgi:hypothetical protein